MSVEIEISTETAETRIGKLGEGILGLADKAKSAGEGIKKNLDFSSDALKQLRDLGKTIDGLNSLLKGFGGNMKQLGDVTRGTATQQTTLRDSVAKSSAAIVTQARAVKDNTTAQSANNKSMIESRKSAQELANARGQLSKIMRDIQTSAQREAEMQRTLNVLYKDGKVSANDMARAMAVYSKSFASAGTDAEKLLANLRQQNAEMNKNPAQLAKMTAGYNLLSAAQKKSLEYNLRIAQDMQTVADITTRALSPLEQYYKQTEALNNLRGRINPQTKQLQITEQEYALKLENARNALVKATDAEAKRSQIRARSATADENAAAALRQYVSQLQASISVEKASEVELLKMRAGWDQLSASEQKAAENTVRLAQDMRLIGDSVRQQLAPIDQLRAKLNALGNARGAGVINPAQYSTGVAAARAEYDALSKSAIRASVGLGTARSAFSLANQGAAALRAGMQGTGVAFGGFAASTVAAAAGAYAITKSLRETIAVGADFQKALRGATAVFGDIGQSKDALQPFIDKFVELSEKTKFSAAEVAEAFKALGQAGQSAQEALTTLPTVLNLATVGEISTEDAANKLVNTLAQFGLAATDAASVADKITAASLASTTTISQLAQALGQVGATAHAAGVGLDATLASISLLRQVGISASKSGTDLRNIIQDLSTQTPRAAKAMAALGVDMSKIWSGPGGTLDLISAFKEMQRAMDGLNPQQKLKFARDIFDKRSSGALLDFIKMLDGSKNSLDAYLKLIQNAQGETQKIANIINDNAVTAFAQLKNAIAGVAIQAFTQYSGQLTDRLKELTAYIIQNGPKIAETITSVMSTLIEVGSLLIKYLPEILKWTAAFIGWKVAVLAIREVAAGLLILEAAVKAVGIAAVATEAKVAGAATAAAAMGAGGAVATSSLATMVTGLTRIAPLLGVVAIGVYSVYSNLKDMADKSAESAAQMKSDLDIIASAEKALPGLTRETASGVLQALQAPIERLNTELEQYKKSLAEASSNPVTIQKIHGETYVTDNTATIKAYQSAVDSLTGRLERTHEVFAALQGKADPYFDDVIAKLGELINKIDLTGSSWTTMIGEIKSGDFVGAFLNGIDQIDRARAELDKEAAKQRASIAEGFAPKGGEEWERNQDEARIRKIGEAATSAKARINELTSELRNIVKAYGSETGATADLNRELAQNAAIREVIAKGGTKMQINMEALGVSSELALKALDWSDQQKMIDAVSAAIGNLDPRYGNLTETMRDVNKAQVDGNKAFVMASAIIEASNAPLEQKTATLALLKPLLSDIDSGAVKSAQSLANLATSTATALAQFQNIDPVKGELESLGISFDRLSEKGKQSATENAQLSIVIKALGTNFLASLDPMGQYLALSNALDASQIKLGLSSEQLAKAHERLWENTPIGSIEKQNKLIAAQIGYAKQGGQNWDAYDIALQSVNGDLSLLTPALLAAAEQQAKLNEELSQIKEVQDAYKNFAEGLSKVFADFVTGGIKNFKDFKDSIKSTFKSLLSDLLQMAIKNALFSFLGFGSGNTGGFWSAILSGAGSMLGGNTGGNSIGGIVSTGSQLLGASGYSTSDLTGMASANYTGGVYAPGYGAGNSQSTGSSWLDWVTNGQSAYSQYTNLGGMNGFMYGSGHTLPGSSYFGTGMYGPGMDTAYAPTALGYGTAIAGGLYAGYNRYQNGYGGGWSAAGGLAYGVGTTALGLGLGSMAAGTGFAAGVGSMAAGASTAGASMGVAAAVPVIGWVALIAMVIDMVSGGKLFGTKGKVVGGASQLDITGSGATASQWYTTKGQKPLFGGSYYKEHDMAVDEATQSAADDFYDAVKKGRDDFANLFGQEMGDIVGGTFVQSFDKHGNPTTSTSTVNGQTYQNETQEQFAGRLQAENITDVLNKVGVDITSYTHKFIADADAYATAVQDAGAAMQAAFIDIKGNVGLFDGADALQKTFDEIVKLKNADESLSDAYARIIGSVQLMDTTLGPMGANLNKTRQEYIEWSAELVNSLGGLQAAQQIMSDFSDTFGIAFNTGQYAMDQAQKRLQGLLSSIGLNVNTTVDQFAEAFQKMLPNMTSAEAADWLRVAESFSALKKMKDALGDFMFGIDEQLAKFEGRTFTHQMEAVNRQMEANIRQARALGASEADLNRIRKLAVYQIAELMGQLKAELKDLVGQLHGDNQHDQQQAQQAAHDAQMGRIESERQAEEEKYQAAQDAISQIKDLLNELSIGDLSPQGTQGRMENARDIYQQTMQDALAGDPEAMGNLAGAAQDYLEAAQNYFGSGVDYASIFDEVTQALRDAQTAFEAIPKPPESTAGGAGGGGGSTTTELTDTERFQLSLQIAQDIGQLHIATGADILDLMEAYGVTIGELAENLGVDINHFSDETFANLQMMAQALGVTIPDLLNMLGVNGTALADYFGVKADEIIAGNFDALTQMADTLGINVLDALNIANIPVTALLTGMGIDISKLTTDTPAQLAAVAAQFGLSIIDLMGAAGISMTDLVTAWNNGVPITALDPASMALLGSMSHVLGIDIVQLLTGMGFDFHAMSVGISGALAAGFAALPDLPPDIAASLDPYLTAIATSGSNEELNANTDNLSAYVDTLPEDVKAMLEPVLAGLGISITGTGAATLDDVNSGIDESTAAMNTVAENTGESGPIVAQLMRIADGTEAAGAAAGASATVEFGDTEAAKAMMDGFFDQTFDSSDFYGEESADTSGYTQEADSRSQTTANATAENSAATAKASQRSVEEMSRLCEEMAAMHTTLQRQTTKLSGILTDQVDETARVRRENRLNASKK